MHSSDSAARGREIDFVAPAAAPAAHRAVTVTVVYAMFDGLPAYEKHVVVRAAGAKVRVDALTTALVTSSILLLSIFSSSSLSDEWYIVGAPSSSK